MALLANSSTPNAAISLMPPTIAPTTANAQSFYLVYASVYACGALFLVPSGASWVRMWRNRHIDSTAVRLFSLLGIGTLLRAAAFMLVSAWMLSVAHAHDSPTAATHFHLSYLDVVFLWQLLGMLASFVLGGVFLLVFNTWASMIEQVGAVSLRAMGGSTPSNLPTVFAASINRSTSTTSPPRLLFIQLVVAIYILHIVTFVTLQLSPESAMRHSMYLVATVLLAFCFVICICLLPAYGARMCALLDKVADDTAPRQRNIRRIAAIATAFCCMRTLSLILLAASQYGHDTAVGEASDNVSANDPLTSGFAIPPRDVIEQNPIFFFTGRSDASVTTGLLRWVVLLEVVEFPLEWALLVALLCVLPSKAVLPSIRGYEPILDTKRRVR